MTPLICLRKKLVTTLCPVAQMLDIASLGPNSLRSKVVLTVLNQL